MALPLQFSIKLVYNMALSSLFHWFPGKGLGNNQIDNFYLFLNLIFFSVSLSFHLFLSLSYRSTTMQRRSGWGNNSFSSCLSPFFSISFFLSASVRLSLSLPLPVCFSLHIHTLVLFQNAEKRVGGLLTYNLALYLPSPSLFLCPSFSLFYNRIYFNAEEGWVR